jgi:hypothetical protein
VNSTLIHGELQHLFLRIVKVEHLPGRWPKDLLVSMHQHSMPIHSARTMGNCTFDRKLNAGACLHGMTKSSKPYFTRTTVWGLVCGKHQRGRCMYAARE